MLLINSINRLMNAVEQYLFCLSITQYLKYHKQKHSIGVTYTVFLHMTIDIFTVLLLSMKISMIFFTLIARG